MPFFRLMCWLAVAVCVGNVYAESGHVVPLLIHGGDQQRQGFVRVVNRSEQAGDVTIDAYDDAGVRKGPLIWSIGARETKHFNAGDLENGNPRKGLRGGIGAPSAGDWRLVLRSELDLHVLAYARTKNGFLTSLHHVAPGRRAIKISTFNPASNTRQQSRLRLINPNAQSVVATLRGVDDAGTAGETDIRVTVPARASATLTATDLERGASGLQGRLGDGVGKWRLELRADQPLQAMSLISSPTGHITNLSAVANMPHTENGLRIHRVPLFPAAAGVRQGFVRVLNRESQPATVRITAVDDAGRTPRAVTLTVASGHTAHFNSDDLENGNAAKGLRGIGSGDGYWRLTLETDAAIEVLAYIRTRDGFLTSMLDLVPATGYGHHVATFNPASNSEQRSLLRLVNAHDRAAKVTIAGTDDAGIPGQSLVSVTLAPRVARTVSAHELEAGVGVEGALGDGHGKWRLAVRADRPVDVMNLLESVDAHLSNLSRTPPGAVAGAAAAIYRTRVSETTQAKCLRCHVSGGDAANTRLVFVPRGAADDFALNLAAIQEYVRRGPGGEQLLAKTRGDDAHGGGVQASPGEEGYADFRRLVELSKLRTISFAAAESVAIEGGEAVFRVVVEPPLQSRISVRYSLGPDQNPDTADAIARDFAEGLSGEVQIARDASTMRIAVIDDNEIEHARETALVALAPSADGGYQVGTASSATIGIAEGICDRTPAIRRKLLSAANRGRESTLTECHEVTPEDLRGISTLYTGPLAALRGKDFLGLSGLTWLGLCHAPDDTALDPGALPRLPDGLLATLTLSGLVIRGCGITELSDSVFSSLISELRVPYLFIDEPLERLPATWPASVREMTLRTDIGHLPAAAFAQAARLSTLYLQGNEHIRTISPDAFDGLSSLERLALDDTRIETLPAGLFAPLTSLRWLQVAKNQLRQLPADLPLTLEHLNLNQNPLVGIPNGMLNGLSKLTDLRAEGCGAPDFDLQRGSLDGLSALKTLQLGGSGVHELPVGLFADLHKLESIRLQDNNIEALPQGLFDGLSSLRSVDFSGNPGAPFPLLLELERIGAGNAAPPPARVRVRMRTGFPVSGAIRVATANGTLTAETVPFESGASVSEEIVVTPVDRNARLTHVGLGPLPTPTDWSVSGVEWRLGEPLVLFGQSNNRMPQATQLIPTRKLQVGGEAWRANMDGCFVDVDGDELRFKDSFVDDTNVVTVTEEDGRLVFTPRAEGTTTAAIVAIDPSGVAVSQPMQLVVEPRPDPSSFDIDLDFQENVDDRMRQLTRVAADQWTSIITGDLPGVPVRGTPDCADGIDVFTGVVDDLRLSVEPLLGLSNYGGLASVARVRDESGLPFLGRIAVRPIRSGALDRSVSEAEADFRRTALHEIAHTLGFTTEVWEEQNLFHNPSRILGAGADTHFSGQLAIQAFDDAGGSGFTARSKVPLHNGGFSNSDVHWPFPDLMDVSATGPLSAITVGVFADLGYEVDPSQAEPSVLPSWWQGAGAPDAMPVTGLPAKYWSPDRRSPYRRCEVRLGPMEVVDRQGKVVRVLEPAAQLRSQHR